MLEPERRACRAPAPTPRARSRRRPGRRGRRRGRGSARATIPVESMVMSAASSISSSTRPRNDSSPSESANGTGQHRRLERRRRRRGRGVQARRRRSRRVDEPIDADRVVVRGKPEVAETRRPPAVALLLELRDRAPTSRPSASSARRRDPPGTARRGSARAVRAAVALAITHLDDERVVGRPVHDVRRVVLAAPRRADGS